MAGQKAAKAAETLKKRRKSPGPLLNGKEKIMKNIQPKPLRPSEAVARRPEAEGVALEGGEMMKRPLRIFTPPR